LKVATKMLLRLMYSNVRHFLGRNDNVFEETCSIVNITPKLDCIISDLDLKQSLYDT